MFRSQDAPRYLPGFAVHMVCYAILIVMLSLLRWHFIRQNRKKEMFLAECSDAVDDKGEHGFDDLTDMQNPNFFYVY